MNNRPRGLYEILVTEAIAAQLHDLGGEFQAVADGLRAAEAPDRLALHVGRIIKRVLVGVTDAERVSAGVTLARALIHQIDAAIAESDVGSEAPTEPGTVL